VLVGRQAQALETLKQLLEEANNLLIERPDLIGLIKELDRQLDQILISLKKSDYSMAIYTRKRRSEEVWCLCRCKRKASPSATRAPPSILWTKCFKFSK
jgi:hypothetical protein